MPPKPATEWKRGCQLAWFLFSSNCRKIFSLHEAKYLRRERWKTKGLEGPARSEGLGLGLAISKAIMELHGGKISAASKGKGTGATFRIEIKSVQDYFRMR
ncbi:MAG: hypothetical protein DMF40_08165 [Verrucomicrobia bacterium]|nr:MAG: hypothetical protein DMF40_08165 [Verrucomicrobiota bacterium]